LLGYLGLLPPMLRWSDPPAWRRLFLTLYTDGGQPEVWELFQEGLSPQFSVAARWHNLLPLPPSGVAVALSPRTELEASGSEAKEMEKIGKEVRMQIPGVPPR
jgi:hypothetical protein